jgi:anti-sigma factor RsiW
MAPDERGHDRRHCRELLTRMARGVEGDLSAAERRALAKHLAGCERCGAFSESLQHTVALCREVGAPTMSERAKARARANVRALLKQKPSPRRPRRSRSS